VFSDGSGPHEVCGGSYHFFLKGLRSNHPFDKSLHIGSKFDHGILFHSLLSKKLFSLYFQFSSLGQLELC
jgi:hypothetical protein